MTMDGQSPRVSVVIPAYNAAHCIERAVKSVREQTERDFEIVIVDDVSTDDTVAVVRSLMKEDARIVLHQAERNGGPSLARNIGLSAARGTWIALLDADDSFKPHRLKTLCDLAEQHGLDGIGDDILYFDEFANVEVRAGNFVRTKALRPVTLDDYLETTTYRVGLKEALYREEYLLSLLKLVLRNSFLRSTGVRYSTQYRYCEDFLFYFDVLRAGAKLALHNEPLYVYTEKLGSISRLFSPYSQTVPDRQSIVTAVDEILQNDRGLTDNQKRLLLLRRNSVLSTMKYERFRREFKQGRRLGFVGQVSTHRDVWFHFLREVRHGITARVKQRLHQRSA